jgi:hypothetical protein
MPDVRHPLALGTRVLVQYRLESGASDDVRHGRAVIMKAYHDDYGTQCYQIRYETTEYLVPCWGADIVRVLREETSE